MVQNFNVEFVYVPIFTIDEKEKTQKINSACLQAK